MISNNGLKLLFALDDIIESDSLVVLDIADIAEKLGDDAIDISGAVDELRLEGFIVVKMFRGDEICLKITDGGRHRVKELKAIAEAESARKAHIIAVTHDAATGKTLVQVDDGGNDDKEERETAVNAPDIVKPKRKHYGITSFIGGFIGGILASVGAILVYVFAIA